MKTRKEARDLGLVMKGSMRNPDLWKVELWENLGWHVAIKMIGGNVAVHTSYVVDHNDPRFFALVSSDLNRADSGLSAWTSPGDCNSHTPQDAVDKAVRAAIRHVQYLMTAAMNATQAM